MFNVQLRRGGDALTGRVNNKRGGDIKERDFV